jgi:hypothetical protein
MESQATGLSSISESARWRSTINAAHIRTSTFNAILAAYSPRSDNPLHLARTDKCRCRKSTPHLSDEDDRGGDQLLVARGEIQGEKSARESFLVVGSTDAAMGGSRDTAALLGRRKRS